MTTGKHIVNMIKTRRGEHPLFRAFGMGAVVDSTNSVTRAQIQAECARWFPGAKVKSVLTDSADVAGNFVFTVEIEGA